MTPHEPDGYKSGLTVLATPLPDRGLPRLSRASVHAVMSHDPDGGCASVADGLRHRGGTDVRGSGHQALVPRPEHPAGDERDRTQQVGVDRTQPATPKPVKLNQSEELVVGDRRERTQAAERRKDDIAALDASECELLDDQRMGPDFIIAEQTLQEVVRRMNVVYPD